MHISRNLFYCNTIENYKIDFGILSAGGAYIILDVGFHADGAKDLLSGLHSQIVIKVEHSLLPVSVRRLWA